MLVFSQLYIPHIEEFQLRIFNICFLYLIYAFYIYFIVVMCMLANSKDPDEMPHNAAFNIGMKFYFLVFIDV